MEGWICPEIAVETFEEANHECMQVMHAGEMVWACDASPIEGGAAVKEADDSLFEKVKTALPNIKLFNFRRQEV